MGSDCSRPSHHLYKLTVRQKEVITYKLPQFKDIIYLTRHGVCFNLNRKYLVKKGFATDGVSSGCQCLSNWLDVETAIAHDFCYATHPRPRDECDYVLAPWWRPLVVECFGSRAWETSYERGALFVTMNRRRKVVLKVYHDYDYEQVARAIELGPEEGSLFASFFEEEGGDDLRLPLRS